jgi:hypothetical protein
MAAVWLEIEQDAGSLVDAARAVYLKTETNSTFRWSECIKPIVLRGYGG